jgi:hypothetical protein
VSELFFWMAIGFLAVYAGIRARVRIQRRTTRVTDEDVRRILEEGSIFVEDAEPLDLETIDEEERRFWEEEPWDPTDDDDGFAGA